MPEVLYTMKNNAMFRTNTNDLKVYSHHALKSGYPRKSKRNKTEKSNMSIELYFHKNIYNICKSKTDLQIVFS